MWILCAAVAAWLTQNVDNFLASNYATARFWETWLEPSSPLHVWVPLICFALITGIGVGIILGLIFPQHLALKIAAVAAVLQLLAAIFASGVASAIVSGVGLLMGALPSRVRR